MTPETLIKPDIPYGYDALADLLVQHQVHTLNGRIRVDDRLEKERRNLATTNQKLLPDIAKDPQYESAWLFYKAMIKPSVPKSSDAFKPTDEELKGFFDQLKSPDGVHFVISMAQCKTLSPIRTGSPDARIDMAEIEAYVNFCDIALAAKTMGMNVRFTLLDEATIYRNNEKLGITEADITFNHGLASQIIKQNDAEGLVRIKGLVESVSGPLGNDYHRLKREKFLEYATEINRELALAAMCSAAGKPNKAYIEAFVLFDCMPNSALNRFGLSSKEISELRSKVSDPSQLHHLPESILEAAIELASECEAILSLRVEAGKRAQAMLEDYPEYNPNGRIPAGITRKESRWTMLPHPRRYEGKTVFPMHGLAVYKEGVYMGNIPYSSTINTPHAEVILHGNKPVFVMIK